MKRKLTALLLLASMLVSLAGCGKGGSYEVALITDIGTVEDGGFNEECYKGIKRLCDEKGLTYNYYIPDGYETANYIEQVNNAVDNGAKVIVCPGYLLEEAVYNCATQYPDVKFILIDGLPHNSDYTDYTIASNVLPITFAEEEAGFLAGYAAVRDGYKRLGFIGGLPEESVIKYGYGFVQGADYAGIELGKKIYIAYSYMDSSSEGQTVYDTAAVFYDFSVEIILSNGGTVDNSVMSAAETKKKPVIGTDIDKKYDSSSVAFSCVKNYEGAVYNALNDYSNGTLNGGVEKHLTVAEDGISLTMDGAFNQFSDIEYNAIIEEMKSKNIVPYAGTDIGTTAELNLVNVEVIYQ